MSSVYGFDWQWRARVRSCGHPVPGRSAAPRCWQRR